MTAIFKKNNEDKFYARHLVDAGNDYKPSFHGLGLTTMLCFCAKFNVMYRSFHHCK